MWKGCGQLLFSSSLTTEIRKIVTPQSCSLYAQMRFPVTPACMVKKWAHTCARRWLFTLGHFTWQFFADGDPHSLISVAASYYRFDVEMHAEFPSRITISKCEIVGRVIRDHDFVAKLKERNFFLVYLYVIHDKLRMPTKISCYTVTPNIKS